MPLTQEQIKAGYSTIQGKYDPVTGKLKPVSTPPVSPPAISQGASYTIKKDDNLSAIASKNGTTVAELLKLNPGITNPNLIYPGKILTLPGGVSGAGSNTSDFSNVNTNADANKAINDQQAQDAAGATMNNEPPTRKTTGDIMKEITTAIKPEVAEPVAADFTGALTTYRSEYGVTALETQLDELRAQEQDLFAQKQTRITSERGKPVAMNVISGRIGQVEQQENERLGVVQRSIANATNQLNTKYNIINTLMKTKELDYNNAVAAYDKEMSNNISIFNAARSIEEEAKSDLEREQDTARSNAQIALNAYTARGMTYTELTPAEKTNLTKLGVQSGLGADFFSNVMSVSAGKDILTTITSEDDTRASIIYKDGTVKTISTGLPAKKVTGSTTGQVTDKDVWNRQQDILDAFNKDLTDTTNDFFRRAKTKANFINLLSARYPDIDPGDIARKVNEVYKNSTTLK